MNESPVLTIEHLTKAYKGKKGWFRRRAQSFVAVRDVSFKLHKGEILGLLGSNGAGKTTIIKMLLGTLKPTSGEIFYFKKNFKIHRSEILQDVSHASAYHKLPGSLSVQKNLEIFARLYGLSKQEGLKRIHRFLSFFEIEELCHKPAAKLSAGQITRVMLAKAFLSYPKVVLLDEPTASLDPDIALQVRRFILEQQREHGVSVILTSHNMHEVAAMCNRVMVLRRGRIIEEDTPSQLARKIARTKVSLRIVSRYAEALEFLSAGGWEFRQVGDHLTVDIDEEEIPALLSGLTIKQVEYSHLEILKPDLEDYFLNLYQEE